MNAQVQAAQAAFRVTIRTAWSCPMPLLNKLVAKLSNLRPYPLSEILRGRKSVPAAHPGMGAIPHEKGVAFRVWAPHAKAVANHLGTIHTEQIVTARDMDAVLPQWASLFDEPFGDSSGVPTYLVSKMARQSCSSRCSDTMWLANWCASRS